MAYGFKHVSHAELNIIVERLTTPTQASRSWRHDYDCEEENLRFLKQHDPHIHPQRSTSPAKMRTIVSRLTKPTVASVSQRWNYDCEDGNLMFLKKFDPNIRLPYRTVSRNEESKRPPTSLRICADDLAVFCDRSRPRSRRYDGGGYEPSW